MLRFLSILSLLHFLIVTLDLTTCEKLGKSQLVYKELVPILKAFRRRAADYQKQLSSVCPNDDPEEVDCECNDIKLPPHFFHGDLSATLNDLRTGNNGRFDILSGLVECQPDYCTCLDGSKATLKKADLCDGEEFKDADLDPNYVALRMSTWAEEIVRCKNE